MHRTARTPAVSMLLVAVLTGMSAIAIDIALPAVPALAQALSTSPAAAQYVLTLYILGFALGQVMWGMLADHYGRRPVMLVALALFVATSALCVLSSNITTLLIARLVQGIAGASGPVIGRAVIRDCRSGDDAARALALAASIVGLAPLFAPLVGGITMPLLGWRGPFIFVLVYSVVVMLWTLLRLPETARGSGAQNGRPLLASLREFLSHRAVRQAMFLIVVTWAGYMAIITNTSSVLADQYHIGADRFGFWYLLAGGGLFAGTVLSRLLIGRISHWAILLVAALIMAAAAALLVWSLVEQGASFARFWAGVSLYCLGGGLLLPIVSAMAIEPMPHMAGKAASFLGTGQIFFGAVGSFLVASFYQGSGVVLSLALVVCAGLIGGFVVFSVASSGKAVR